MSLVNEIKTNSRNSIIKKIIVVLVLLWGGYFSYSYFFSESKDTQEKVETKITSVSKWNIKTFIEADWKALLKDELNLDFANEWIIKEIFVKTGDNVKAWDKIATLDNTYLDIAVQKAELLLKTTKTNYDLKARWTSSGDIEIAREQLKWEEINLYSSISQTKIDLENALQNQKIMQENLENAKKQTEINLLTAENNLSSSSLDLQTALDNLVLTISQEQEKYLNIQNKLVMEVGQIVSDIEKNLFDLDMLLWVSDSNKYQNDSFEIYLWAKNTSLKSSAENSYRETLASFNTFYDDWKIYKTNLDYSKLWEKSENLRNTLMSLNKTLNYTLDTLKNSIASSSFSQTTIDLKIDDFSKKLTDSKNNTANFAALVQAMQEAKTAADYKIELAKNTVSSLEQKLKISSWALDKTKLENELALSTANQKLDQANLLLESTKLKNDNLLSGQNSKINISKVSLDAKIWVDSLELEPYYTAILTAQKNLDEAIKKRNDSILYSPIDWKIAKINWNIKESTSSLKEAFVTIINDKNFYIDSLVEEWDIVKVKNNQEVYISFDAIENLTLTWKVLYIEDKATIDANWLVSYRVEIIFENTDKRIKDAMTATVEFVTKEVKNVLIVPVSAVKNISGKPSVILENSEVKKVITWFTDWKNVEVISGLEKWERLKY